MTSSEILCVNFSTSTLCFDEMDVEICQRYAYQRWRYDFYATSIGASLVVFLGVLGNAGTLFTLSGRRLTTATFVYYRAIGWVDLCRCIFVFTYVMRVLIPFRGYYWTSWYEAHLMYPIIGTLGFVSTTLAVFLCFRLCYCIVQSRRLKKMHTNADKTRRIIYAVAAVSILINASLCFERRVQLAAGDECSFAIESNRETDGANETTRPPVWNGGGKKYALAPSEFSYAHSSLLKVVHNLPAALLLVLFVSTLILLLLCIVSISSVKHQEILSNRDSSNSNSKTWRTQRQLCRLFLILSVSYAFGLLPSLIYEVVFNTKAPTSTHNATVETSDEYDSRRAYEEVLAAITRRQLSATILNVIQNFAHAISFYVYLLCSVEFRNEFLNKLKRLGGNLQEAYSSVGLSRFSARYSRKSSPTSPLIALNSAPLVESKRCRRIKGSLLGEQQFLSYSHASARSKLGQQRGNGNAAKEPLLSENEQAVGERSEQATSTRQSHLPLARRIQRMSTEMALQFHKRVSVGIMEGEHVDDNNDMETALCQNSWDHV